MDVYSVTSPFLEPIAERAVRQFAVCAAVERQTGCA